MTQIRYRLVYENKQIDPSFDVAGVLKILKVSKSGYYAHLKHKRSKRALYKEKIQELILSIYYQNYKVYGSPKITARLNDLGYKIAKRTVAAYMKERECNINRVS